MKAIDTGAPGANRAPDVPELFARNRAWAEETERERPGFFTSLVDQQTPRYMWIGCSDSRVPANQITGLDPGKVFVHRNVANVIVHSDLNALSTVQFAVDMLRVRDIMVVGHYECGGVLAALRGDRVGIADNWLRHVQDVRDRHSHLLRSLAANEQARALVELNVIEQVKNLCVSTVITDAWSKGQDLTIYGWAYGVHDGLLKDLAITVAGPDELQCAYGSAIARVALVRTCTSPHLHVMED